MVAVCDVDAEKRGCSALWLVASVMGKLVRLRDIRILQENKNKLTYLLVLQHYNLAHLSEI